MFFAGDHMNNMLAPITTYVKVSNLLWPRLVAFVDKVILYSVWIFPQMLSLSLATVFSHQYSRLQASFLRRLANSDGRAISDFEIESLRHEHEQISTSVKDADKFLMFPNAGATEHG